MVQEEFLGEKKGIWKDDGDSKLGLARFEKAQTQICACSLIVLTQSFYFFDYPSNVILNFTCLESPNFPIIDS